MYVSPISSRFWLGRFTPAMRATYPCLCLCRGFVQMTIVRPCRLITRQRSHMALTDARTFICFLSVSVGNPAAGQVVGRELHLDLVAREDADVVLAHLPGDGREDRMPAVDLDEKHGAREGLGDLAFDLDLLFFIRQIAFLLCARKHGGTSRREPIMVANRPLRAFSPGSAPAGRRPGWPRCARNAQPSTRPWSRSTTRRRGGTRPGRRP